MPSTVNLSCSAGSNYFDLFGNVRRSNDIKKKVPKKETADPFADKMVHHCDFIPHASIHPDRICVYNQVNWQPSRPNRVILDEAGQPIDRRIIHILNSDRRAHGAISVNARRKMTKALDYLLLLARPKTAESRFSGKIFKFRVAFVTLTLPSEQQHPDSEIIRVCLNSFLIELKKFYQVKNYIWRAEKQKNGNIHFHILIDRFVPWSEMRDRWNRIVNKLGYVDRYRAEMRKWHRDGFRVRKELLKNWDYKSQVRAYKNGSKSDWNSPNSSDIHSIRKVSNVKLYVLKYISKEAGVDGQTGELFKTHKQQTGRVWGCNHELSKCPGAVVVRDWQISDELFKVQRATKCRFYVGDYFSVYYIDFQQLKKSGCTNLYTAFCSFLFEHFNFEFS